MKSEYHIKKDKKTKIWGVYYLNQEYPEMESDDKRSALSYLEGFLDAEFDLREQEKQRPLDAINTLTSDGITEIIAKRMKKDKEFAKLVNEAVCNLARSVSIHLNKKNFKIANRKRPNA